MLPVILTSLRRKFTDRGTLVNLVLLPILLVVILGSALASTFSTDSAATSAGTTSLVVVDNQQTAGSQALVSYVKSLTSVFTVTTSTSDDSARDAVGKGQATVMVSIAAPDAAAASSGVTDAVSLYAVDSNVDQLKAVKVALTSFDDAVRAGAVAQPGDGSPAYQRGDYIAPTAVSSDASQGLGALTYYTVTMLVLVLIYGLAHTMNFVNEEYDGPLGDRYLVSPLRRVSLIAAQWVSGVISSLVQAALLIGCSMLVFGVRPGAHWAPVVGVIVLAAMLFAALGLVLGLLGRSRPWLDQLVTVAIPLLTFLGGGFVKVDLAGLEQLSPNRYFQDLIFWSLRGQSPSISSFATLAEGVAFLLVVALVLLSRKQAR